MTVSCARPDDDAAGARTRVGPGAPGGPLVHGLHLAAGVRGALDPMSPHRWHAVSGPAADVTAGPLLHAVLGHGAPAAAAPWLRLAAVDALDRWLPSPLDQGLLNAERGVARGRAARTLPHGPARAVLTGEALRSARRSSRDVVGFLRRLGRRSRPLPGALCCTLSSLVDGYRELVGDVTGHDRDLASVVEGWRRLSRRLEGAEQVTTDEPADPPPSSRPVRAPGPMAGVVDPRQVRARVVALSADPAEPEVTVTAADAPDAVLVRVPCFGPRVDADLAARMLVRLVDRRSGEPRCHALLRVTRDGTCLEATVPLRGLAMTDVRVDVVDALSERPPAADDTDGRVQEARRAVVLLGEWRRLVACAHLGLVGTVRAHRLRALAARLHPTGAPADTPLFAGGPSCAELATLADLGDRELLRRLRGEGPLHEGLRALTAGPAGLLVAELAAVLPGTAA